MAGGSGGGGRDFEIAVLTFQNAPKEFWESLPDYLRRSGDELLVEELESLMAGALAQERPDLLALGAFDGSRRMVGWCLLALRTSTASIGSEVVVWGVYVFPGRARLRELVDTAMPAIEAYARGAGSSRLVLHTRRISRPYIAMLRRMGWEIHSVCMVREVKE